jgi:hypothetical protein
MAFHLIDENDNLADFHKCLKSTDGRLTKPPDVFSFSLTLQNFDFAAWRGDDRRARMWGDTDTVGAILGALMGAVVGTPGIPRDWLDAIRDWPRSISFMQRVSVRLSAQAMNSPGPIRYFWPGLIVRNLLFLVVVLLHGFRRLAPPY